MYYLLRDKLLSPRVKGIFLPNSDDLSNIQVADDIAILVDVDENNLASLMTKMDILCEASGSKISLAKSIMLG